MTNNYLFVAVSLLLTSSLFSNILSVSTLTTPPGMSVTIFQDINDPKITLQDLIDRMDKLIDEIPTRDNVGDTLFYPTPLAESAIHARYKSSLQELYFLLHADSDFSVEDFIYNELRSSYTQQVDHLCHQLKNGIKIDIHGLGASLWLHSLQVIVDKLSDEDRCSPGDAMFYNKHIDQLLCYIIESMDHCIHTLQQLKSVHLLAQYQECYNACKELKAALVSSGDALQQWLNDERNFSLLAVDYSMLIVLDQILHAKRNVGLILNDAQAACFEELLRNINSSKQVL